MICVTKDEAKELRKILNGVFIMRTVKQKSKRGRFYVEETAKVIDTINKIRNWFYRKGI